MKQRMAVAGTMMMAMCLAAAAMPARAQAVKSATAADPQVKDDLFDGTEQFAKNATDVTEVTMDPQTLNMVDGKDKERAHRMRLNVVRTYTYDKPGMYDMAEVEKFRAKLNTGDWHCSVRTRSLKTGNSTDVCQKTRTDGLVESAIMTVEAKQLTFIHTIREKGSSSYSYGGWSGNLNQESWTAGVPASAMSAVLRAQMAASNAEMRASVSEMRPEMLAGLAQMHVDLNNMHLGRLTVDLDGLRHLPTAAVPPAAHSQPPAKFSDDLPRL